MTYTYTTRGTCARQIMIDVENDVIKSVKFAGGCMGNTQGIAKLVEGMNIDDVIQKMEGIECGGKGTSCPDQLAQALKLIKEEL